MGAFENDMDLMAATFREERNTEINQLKSERAARFNTGKLRWMLMPIEWPIEIVKIFTKGAIKYNDNNWLTSINTEKHDDFANGCLEAAYRHIAERREGKLFDEDTLNTGIKRIDGTNFTQEQCDRFNSMQTYHLAHAAWNLLAVMLYDMRKKK